MFILWTDVHCLIPDCTFSRGRSAVWSKNWGTIKLSGRSWTDGPWFPEWLITLNCNYNMFILSNGRALFDFWLWFIKGTGDAEPDSRRDKVLLYAKDFDKLNASLRRFCSDEHYLDLEDEETLSRGRSAVCEPLTFITWNCGHNIFILWNGRALSGFRWSGFSIVIW